MRLFFLKERKKLIRFSCDDPRMDIRLAEPMDITPTSVLDITRGGTLTTDYMRTLDDANKFNRLLSTARKLSTITTPEKSKIWRSERKSVWALRLQHVYSPGLSSG